MPRLFALLIAILPLPAMAQGFMQNQPEAILPIVQQFGSAVIDTPDAEGRPFITGTIDGINYGILFYDCFGGRGCESVQFFASFESDNNTLEFVNQWNFDRRYSAAYLDPDGDVILNYSVNIDFGVSRANFEDTVDIWALTLNEFSERLYGPPQVSK